MNYKITSYKNTNGVKIYTIEKNGTPLMQCSDYNTILQKYRIMNLKKFNNLRTN